MANKYDKILGEYRENDGIVAISGASISNVVWTFDGTTVRLNINGVLAHSWTVAAPTSGTLTGQPYGLLLALTQP